VGRSRRRIRSASNLAALVGRRVFTEKVVEVHMAETMRELNIVDETLGDERLMRWAPKLRAMPDECVAVIGGTPFNFACVFALFD
jgi:hypothetical protein